MALTDRIEIFCNEFIKTNNQRKSYRAAYPSAERWSDEAVDSKASAFAKTDKVLIRLAEIRAEIENDNKIDRNEIIEQLKSIGFADISHEAIKPSDKIKALELMVKMLGMDKPEGDDSLNRLDKVLGRIEGNI